MKTRLRRFIPLALAIACALAHAADTVPFPDPQTAWLKEGTFANVENLRQIAPGLTKDQVYALLQEPHFSEGFGARDWNYLFNFRTGHDSAYTTCQYQIRYEHGRVASTAWRDPACADFVTPSVKSTAPIATSAMPVTLQADTLFAFDSAELTAAGEHAMDELGGRVKALVIGALVVTGYTDRLGTDTHNFALSARRARAVADALAARGVVAQRVIVGGAGAADPVVACAGSASPEVIACLAPNRRVVVEIQGVHAPENAPDVQLELDLLARARTVGVTPFD